MTTSIGLRANPNEVFYTIATKDNEIELKIIDSVIVPIALNIPEKLKFIRNTFIDILEEYNVDRACIRIKEPTAQSISIERINIEAILQELLSSSKVEKYYIGQISSITAKLQIPRDDFKQFVSGKKCFMEIENWNSFDSNERESVISAISALNL